MSTKDAAFMCCNDFFNDGRPYTFEPESFDSWPNEQATETLMATLEKIQVLGYKGLIVKKHKLADGQILLQIFANQDTPEGRIVKLLEDLARSGKFLPTGEVISILEISYHTNMLALPSKSRSLS